MRLARVPRCVGRPGPSRRGSRDDLRTEACQTESVGVQIAKRPIANNVTRLVGARVCGCVGAWVVAKLTC